MTNSSESYNQLSNEQRVSKIIDKIILNTREIFRKTINSLSSKIIISRFGGDNLSMSYSSDENGEGMEFIIIEARLGKSWGIIEFNRIDPDGEYEIEFIKGNLNLEDTISMMEKILAEDYPKVVASTNGELATALQLQ